MKNQVIIIAFFLLPALLFSQSIEVLGKLKVSQMDTSNTSFINRIANHSSKNFANK